MRVAVLGGGISGLVVAHGLARGGADVVCVDAGARPGGLVRSERIEGFLCETGPQGVLDGAPEVRGLIDELGLREQVVAASPTARRRYIYAGGKLRLVPTSPPALLTTNLLSWRGRLRLLREPFVRTPPPEHDESVLAFAERRIGAEAARALAAPAVIGVFAGDAAKLSIRTAFPRLADAERDHGSVMRGLRAARKAGAAAGKLVSFADGLETLPRAIAAELGPRMVRAHATALERVGGAWRIASDAPVAALAEPFDRVVLACSPATLATLLAPHAPSAAEAVRAIPLAPGVIVCLGYRDGRDLGIDLRAYGFLVARGEGRALLGCQYETSVFPGRAPAGGVLLRAIYGGSFHPELVDESDDQLVARALDDVGAIAGLRRAPDVRAVFRHRAGIPQYEVGHHAARVRAVDDALASLPGLHVLGYALRGVALTDGIRAATKLASGMLQT